MKKHTLGDFEEIAILTIGVLYRKAYGVAIKKEIESRLSRTLRMGALHSALVRLEHQGYIISYKGECSAERAGHPRKYFEISDIGKKAIIYNRVTREHLWKAIAKLALKPSST